MRLPTNIYWHHGPTWNLKILTLETDVPILNTRLSGTCPHSYDKLPRGTRMSRARTHSFCAARVGDFRTPRVDLAYFWADPERSKPSWIRMHTKAEMHMYACTHVRMYGCMYVPTYVRIICIIRKLYTYRVCIILSIVRVSIITVHVSCTYPFIIIYPLIFCHCWILLEHCFDRL